MGVAMRLPYLFSAMSLILLPGVLGGQSVPSGTQTVVGLSPARQAAHQSAEWVEIERHLPSPVTGSAHDLEMQGDILRARRFPEDALDFYNYALNRGAKPGDIYKKLGMTHLELHEVMLARMYFQRALKADRKDASAWNDLGAVEYLNQQLNAAIGDYKRSVKLDSKSAVYHSNLGMAYFDKKDFNDAHKEIATAMKLDPSVFTRSGSSGVSAHVLSSSDRAQFCLEMAKTYAQAGNAREMLHSLSMAGEAGADLTEEMNKDKALAAYKKDPQVLMLIRNIKAMREGRPVEEAGTVPAGARPPVQYETP
jgi:tetratricopeptide (TPR) repeat protein